MLSGNVALDEEKIRFFISAIKNKKELREISADFIRDELFLYLEKNQKKASLLRRNFHPRSSVYKQIMKDVRAILRRSYGLFRIGDQIQQRQQLIEELKSSPERQKDILQAILATHSSTRERLPFYDKLYQKILAITGKPHFIFDIGCGINPFSIPFMKIKKLQYRAYDISEEDIHSLREFFAYLSSHHPIFSGTADILDARQWSRLEKLPKADICFLFKMTDVLDRGRNHKVSEQVISQVPAAYVIVSFSTMTMSGRQMKAPERKWLQWMCRRLNYHYTAIRFINEIFYVIRK